MSDPVANVDIEDVLSSIRRLVSNSPEAQDGVSRPARGAGRLVLTPSQRVDDSGDEEATPPERRASEPPAPEISEATAEADPEPESIFPQDDEVRAETATQSGGGEAPDPSLDGIAAMFAGHDGAIPTAWEPDGDDEDAFADGAEAPALDWRDAGADEDGEDAGRDRAAEHVETVERDWGTEAPGDAENAFAIDDEAVLDEDALRDLVAEIVREELMGTLGERITRNVRKLVRREIHRALNSQDFD